MEVSSILIGGAIGFMSAIAKDFLLENKKSKEKKLQFKKEKLEEIFLLIGRISKEFKGKMMRKVQIRYFGDIKRR